MKHPFLFFSRAALTQSFVSSQGEPESAIGLRKTLYEFAWYHRGKGECRLSFCLARQNAREPLPVPTSQGWTKRLGPNFQDGVKQRVGGSHGLVIDRQGAKQRWFVLRSI